VEQDGIRRVDRIRTLNSHANLGGKKQIFGPDFSKIEDHSILHKHTPKNLTNVNSKVLKLSLKIQSDFRCQKFPGTHLRA
jgi:hypothetical protein